MTSPSSVAEQQLTTSECPCRCTLYICCAAISVELAPSAPPLPLSLMISKAKVMASVERIILLSKRPVNALFTQRLKPEVAAAAEAEFDWIISFDVLMEPGGARRWSS